MRPDQLTDRETKNLFRWLILCAGIFIACCWSTNALLSGEGGPIICGRHGGCTTSGCWGWVILPSEFDWKMRLCMMSPALMGIAVFEILRDKKLAGRSRQND
jgi:hypothetical protein